MMARKQPKRKTDRVPSRRKIVVLLVIAAAVLATIALAIALKPRKVVSEEALTRWNTEWPQVPASGQSAHAENIIRDAYAFAANREDIVRYIPCYCGCERKEHHQSLRDCFIHGRVGDGTPQWDPMGYT